MRRLIWRYLYTTQATLWWGVALYVNLTGETPVLAVVMALIFSALCTLEWRALVR